MLHRPALTTMALLLLLPIAPARAGSRPDRLLVEPEIIRIGLFYSGQDVRVTASTPVAGEIVVRVSGPDEPLVLKKKGKKYGLLWMNVGEVRYQAVPTLYILRSSRKLDEMAAPRTLDRLRLGFDALRNQVPAGAKDGARELFGELLKLKQQDHLFSCEAAGVQRCATGDGGQLVTAKFSLPAKAPVGDYTVDVFGFQGRDGELIGTAKIHLERSSAVSWITSLAANHGLLYGCLAVVVALIAGLITGYLFGR